MRQIFSGMAVVLLMASCASGDPYANAGKAHVVVEPTTDYAATYQIQLRNYENEAVNLHHRATRLKVLDDAMADYCDKGYAIKREEAVADGLLKGRNRHNNFYIYTKCL